MAKEPDLEGAYSLSGPDETRALYSDWAETYDENFSAAQGYRLPQLVAETFVASGGSGPVLDVGAGTGLVADHLADSGVGPVDALDLSAEMLEVARRKGRYRALYEADVTRPLDLPGAPYMGVISAGTFTLGHVGPEGLPPLLQVAAPGALFVITVNAAHYEAAGFKAALEGFGDRIQALTLQDVAIYDDRASGDHAGDTARILSFRRA